jgi:DNA-binding IclR family transcriptional regulator
MEQKSNKPTQPSGSSTVEKTLDVLFYLHEAGQPVGLTAIARALAMPKSSVHRLLVTLLRRGLVEQSERGHYAVGIALIALGLGALAREPLAVAARPILEQVAADIGETLFLVVARAGRLIVLDKAEGSGFLRAAPLLGSSVPVHATAVGKLYLLHAPEQVPEQVQRQQWERYTEHTLADQLALTAELERVRQQGWASNLDEWQPGLSVLAAPVWVGERLLGTVALALVSARLHQLGKEKLARRVVHAAESIALRLEGKSDESLARR